MRLADLEAFMSRAGDTGSGCYPCRHGHTACSDRPQGRCSDEAWQQQCSDESDESYNERMEVSDV
jgi:hypothetical protein